MPCSQHPNPAPSNPRRPHPNTPRTHMSRSPLAVTFAHSAHPRCISLPLLTTYATLDPKAALRSREHARHSSGCCEARQAAQAAAESPWHCGSGVVMVPDTQPDLASAVWLRGLALGGDGAGGGGGGSVFCGVAFWAVDQGCLSCKYENEPS